MPIRLLARPPRSSSPSPLSPSASSESLYTLDYQRRPSSTLTSRSPSSRVIKNAANSSRTMVVNPLTASTKSPPPSSSDWHLSPISTSSIAVATFISVAVVALFSNVLFSTSSASSTTASSPSSHHHHHHHHHHHPGHGGSYWQRVGETLEWVAAGIPETWGQYDFFIDDNIFWTYNRGQKSGPENWGKLRNTSSSSQELMFPLCNSTREGAQQSPVNITTTSSSEIILHSFSTLERHFDHGLQFEILAWPAPFNQPSPGFQVRPTIGSASWVVDNKTFLLWQFHYHSPSEHLLDGIRFPLEGHFVYQHIMETGEVEFAVFGILYSFDAVDDPNPFLEPWWKQIYHEGKVEDGKIDLEGMINDLDSMLSSDSIGRRDQDNKQEDVSPTYFYRYNGSLTTPPCLEGIHWHVAKSAHGISFKQARDYSIALKMIDNHRDVQPLNGRVIKKYQI